MAEEIDLACIAILLTSAVLSTGYSLKEPLVTIKWNDVTRNKRQTDTEASIIRSIIQVLPNNSSVVLSTFGIFPNQTQTLFHMTVGQEDSHWLESLNSFYGSNPSKEVSAACVVNEFSLFGLGERPKIAIFIVTHGTLLCNKTELAVLKTTKTYVVFVNEIASPQAKDWGSLATSSKHLFFYRAGKTDFEEIKSLLLHDTKLFCDTDHYLSDRGCRPCDSICSSKVSREKQRQICQDQCVYFLDAFIEKPPPLVLPEQDNKTDQTVFSGIVYVPIVLTVGLFLCCIPWSKLTEKKQKRKELDRAKQSKGDKSYFVLPHLRPKFSIQESGQKNMPAQQDTLWKHVIEMTGVPGPYDLGNAETFETNAVATNGPMLNIRDNLDVP